MTVRVPHWLDVLGACALLLLAGWILASCATATPRARSQPPDLMTTLIEFHGAVAAQYEAGGMELEHYNVVNTWIGDEVRVLTTNPTHWEGQARLGWPRVRSICLPFESLVDVTHRVEAFLQ